MKKNSYKNSVLLCSIFFFCVIPLSFAQPETDSADKTITLKDGTKIKGRLTGVQNDSYVVETRQLGTIHVKSSEVLSINSQDISAAPVAESSQTQGQVQGGSLKGQVQGLQNQILSNPQNVADIQELLQDPEFVEIIKDPQFVDAIMSYDVERIKSNPSTQTLLQNPKMQALIQKMGAQQQNR